VNTEYIEKYTTSTFRNKKGQQIFYRNWKTGANPKGIILLIHGLNSHSGYFRSFALQLNKINVEVYAMDIVGRGQSDGERYYISAYSDIVNDIDQLTDIAKSANPVAPVFLFGHSAGGVFAAVYAVQHQDKLKGLISASFAFQIPAPAFALSTMKVLGYLIPHARVVKLNNEDFSRDTAIVSTMNNDLLLAKEKQPTRTMQQLILADEYLKKRIPELKLSLFILHGTADKVTKPVGSQYFMVHASSNDKQLNLYDGYCHDLINDKDNDRVIGDIIDWLYKRI
jgi:acylglycerol lipase